jgi:hypothetical protein
MNGEEKLNKQINFAVKNPKFIDFSETLLELKRTIRAYEDATLNKNWEGAYDLSMALVDASQRLEDIAQQMYHDQK